MTRTAQHTPTRPPTRRDPRRPGTGTPRGQGGGTSRTAPVAVGPENTVTGRRTGTPATGSGTRADGLGTGAPGSGPGRGTGRTAPGDGRPAAAPGRGARTAPGNGRGAATAARGARTAAEAATVRDAAATAPPQAAGQGTHQASRHAEPHTVPARATQVATRPRVPQPRPTDVFADRLLAVLSGQRPVHWMLRHTAGPAYDELIRLAEHGPLRATRGVRPVVRDIGYYVARPGAVEAFARIGAGDQVRAMAFRLEQGADLRWRCTAVELGGPRAPHRDDD
ncbi:MULTISPECIES: Rv3235 family protein [unclassified Streptomyces]|uniref:Rv3235 family protein n=1 Tax=unclassified Streptomyces TaxID=2593676 RepID=UPI00403CDA17